MSGSTNKIRNVHRTLKPLHRVSSPAAARCKEKFLRFFPQAFRDETYLAWERDYKWKAHLQWEESLAQGVFRTLIEKGKFSEIAARATRIESRTNLLFSFEKMALRDAVKQKEGAKTFSLGLYDFLHGIGSLQEKLERWITVVGTLPRKQTRVLTWPLLTVFGFIAQPDNHIFLKPNVTRAAAEVYKFDFDYRSKPNWQTYSSLLEFARVVENDISELRPRDMIDIQSFIWVLGSDEYEE